MQQSVEEQMEQENWLFITEEEYTKYEKITASKWLQWGKQNCNSMAMLYRKYISASSKVMELEQRCNSLEMENASLRMAKLFFSCATATI